MSIPLTRDPDGPPYERCCFCRARTAYWTDLPDRDPGKQVACCPKCAKKATPKDVPSKKTWWRREVIAEDRTF